jgi:hypothetical protein
VERHYAGRRQRLEAQAAWLECALAAMVSRPRASVHAARVASELVIVRHEAQLAARRRIPVEHGTPSSETAPVAA